MPNISVPSNLASPKEPATPATSPTAGGVRPCRTTGANAWRLRTERHPNANLARPCPTDYDTQPVDPEARRHQRRHRQQQHQRHLESPLRHRCRQHVIHRPHRRHCHFRGSTCLTASRSAADTAGRADHTTSGTLLNDLCQ
jgi:hypothetical protein